MIAAVFRGLAAILEGLGVTLRHLGKKPVTVEYPDRKPFTGIRWRGVHGLFFTDDKETELCVSCHLCARVCPAACISMEGHVEEDRTKKLHIFDVDLGRCIYCGYCEEVCPVDAIRLTTSTDYTVRNRADFVLHKEDLLAVGRAAMERGEKGALGVRRGPDEETLSTKEGIGTKEFAARLTSEIRRRPWPGAGFFEKKPAGRSEEEPGERKKEENAV